MMHVVVMGMARLLKNDFINAIFTVALNEIHSPNNVYNRYYFQTCLTTRYIATCCVN
jgi:hypothetical protein